MVSHVRTVVLVRMSRRRDLLPALGTDVLRMRRGAHLYTGPALVYKVPSNMWS